MDVAVGNLGLDGVANLTAEEPLEAGGDGEGTLYGRRTDINAEIDGAARGGDGDLDGRCVGRIGIVDVVGVGDAAGARVEGFAQSDAGKNVPTGKRKWERKLRANVQALNDAG